MRKIKVVIPCRNEVKNIEECVDSVIEASKHFEGELEVIIVDGKSDDGTVDVIQKLIDKYGNVKMVVNEMQLTPYAFNLGIKTPTAYDFISIVGSRHVLSPNYYQEAIKKFDEDSSIWCVGGRVDNVFANETGKYAATAMGTSFGMGLGNFRAIEKSGYVDTVGTPIYPSWVFEKIGFFDEELVRNQDDEFNFRVKKADGKVYYMHEISVLYYVRSSFAQLKKQFMQYGYWKVYVNKKHKAVTTMRQLVPPLFVLYLAFCLLPFLISPLIGVISSTGLMAYLLLNIASSMRNASSLKEFWHLILIFPFIHVSYGYGYLKGIAHFLILGKKPGKKYAELSR